jgi:hypothetical protein
MKNKALAPLFIPFCALALFACGTTPSGGSSGVYVPSIDNSKDLNEYEGDEFPTGEGTYYTSDYISFIMEVRGYYQTDVPFTVDEENKNLRIYDDMYFYEGDFFQLMSSDYKHIWATLKDESTEYLTPLREQGEDIQVDVNVSGVYKIVLDITTMVMDFEYKSEIVTPYYYPFKNCDIGTLVDGHIVFNTMAPNPENADEFMIENYAVETGKLYSFYSSFTHTSNYKLTVQEGYERYISPSLFETSVVFNLSGSFNIYVNRKTYTVRAEIADPSTLVYDCLTLVDGEWITLTPKDASTPYLFEYEYEATADYGGYGVRSDDLPKFYNKSYKEYVFTVEDSTLVGSYEGKYYFKKPGVYLLTLDLLNMTLGVQKALE